MRNVNIESTVTSVRALINEAKRNLRFVGQHDYGGADDWWYYATITSSLNCAYTQLMIMTESLGLTHTYDQIRKCYDEAAGHKDGFSACEHDPDGELYLLAESALRRFVSSVEAVYGMASSHVVSKDVIEVLRATQYAITDRNCFAQLPASEADVHQRIETVLRCIFPDLDHKPPIPKAVKNFEPDTGLPSIRTLVEYKFIQTNEHVKRVADEILADTCGYKSSEWDKFVFVIYETKRLKPERDWNRLLHQCGTALNTEAIVLCGEAPKPKSTLKKRRAKSKPSRASATRSAKRSAVKSSDGSSS